MTSAPVGVIFGHITMNIQGENKKIGLALGSGSARGLAHIGVIKVLEENHIPISMIAGTSMGALIGALYASGLTGTEMEEIACNTNQKTTARLFMPTPSLRGLIDGNRISDFLISLMGTRSFSSLSIPFAAVAADIERAEEVVITEGLLIKAIRASISIPGIFTPAMLKGRALVDGGLMNPVPVDVVKDLGADYIIAVDVARPVKTDSVGLAADLTDISEKELQNVSSKKLNDNLTTFVNKTINWDQLKTRVNELTQEFWDSKIREPARLNVFKILMSSWNIVENQITELQLARHKPDMHIKPGLDNVGFFDFHKAGEIIKIGEIEAGRKLKAILPD